MAVAYPLAVEAGIAAVSAGLAEACTLAVAMLPARRAPAEAHWTERARLAWVPRVLASSGPILVVFLIGIPFFTIGTSTVGTVLVCLAAWLAATLVTLPAMTRLLGRRATLRGVLGTYAISFLVRGPGLLVCVGMLFLLRGHGLGLHSALIMAGSLVLALSLTFGAAFPLLRAVRLITPAPERLWRLTAAVAARAGLPEPRSGLLHWQAANALAFFWLKLIVFTPSALAILDDEETAAVIAHELAHLYETRRQRLTRLSGLLLIFCFCTFPAWLEEFGAPGLFIPMVVFFLGSRLLRRFSQKMEVRADAAAHGEDPLHLARALEKLAEYNLIPAVLSDKSLTHPHLYDRLLTAGHQPVYPRPFPASRNRQIILILLLAVLTCGLHALQRQQLRPLRLHPVRAERLRP